MTTPFTGWGSDATAFLAAITADNTREFWDAHRARFEVALRSPLRALAAALEPEFGPIRLFRPRVDRRFRPAAPPYRTDVGGIAAGPGGATLDVVLSAGALTAGAGHRRFDAGQLRRYRAAVTDERAGPRLQQLLAVAAGGPVHGAPAPGGSARAGPAPGAGSGPAAGVEPGPVTEVGPGPVLDVAPSPVPGVGTGRFSDVEPGSATDARPGPVLAVRPGPVLTGRPRGVAADHPRPDLVRRLGLEVGASWPVGQWLGTTEPLERVRAVWRAAAPVLAWLAELVGPAEPVAPRPRPAPAERVAVDGREDGPGS